MGWDSDHILFDLVRDKILKDRYAGCIYSYNTSLSPIIVQHRGEVTPEERAEITALFPDLVRVEFQPCPDEFKGEYVTIPICGATRAHPLEVQLSTVTENAIIAIMDNMTAMSTAMNYIKEHICKK